MQTEMQVSLDCKASLPSDNISIKEGDAIITSSTTSIDLPLQSVKKVTRQWAAWTRQEEESFFNALRQVGKNFEKITSCVQSKNKDQVRHYYYRLVRRMNKLLGPGLSLDAKIQKILMLQCFDGIHPLLIKWSLLEKYSCKASKLHLKPRRFKIFVEALEHQLLKDRRKNLRKRPAQGDNCISTSPTTGQNDSKISGPEALSVKLVIVDSQNIQRVGSGKGSSLKRNANMGINRSNNKGNSSTVTTSKQRRKPGAVSSAAYKRWEKAAIAGVSLVADAAEHLERTSINAKNNLDHGPTYESFPRPVVSTNGSVDKVLQLSIPSEHQIMENSVQPFVKLKLQLFPIDDETKRALEKDEHNPHLELTLSARKRISSVLEHLNRKWGDSSVASGDMMLFPYSVQRENLVAYQRWTQDTFASAADVYAIMGSPSVFRLRYGWFSDPELGSSTSAAHSSSNIQEEHRIKDVFNDNEPAADVAAVPAPPAGQDAMEFSKEQINLTTEDTALMSSYRDLSEEMTSSAETSPGHNLPSSEHQANSSLLGKETVNGRRWEDMDNLRLSNGTTLSAGEWADSLTTISIGDLLSEASHDASVKLQASGSSQCLPQIPFSCDSLDAAFAAHLSGDQGNMGQEPAHVSNTSSIWDAEETCDGFSFQKISALDQEIPCSSGITTLGASKEIPGASSMGFQGLVEEITEGASLDDPDGEVDRSGNIQSCLHSSDGSGKNLTEFNDIYWPDSLGPLDLDIPSSRYLSEDIILGDSVSLSGLNRLLASSLDALQNCSFFGLDKKEPSSVIEAPGTAPLSEYKIGG